jgi:hypothetical protein
MTSLREEDQKLGPVCLFLVCFVFSSSPPSILFLFFCTVTNGLLGCWVVVAPFTLVDNYPRRYCWAGLGPLLSIVFPFV